MILGSPHARVLSVGEGRTRIMGVVNVTPDSFSDGGLHLDTEAAIAHGRRLVDEGADVLDIGGESTRPGYEPVPAGEQVRRILPVVRALRAACPVPIAVDTTKASVAAAALDAGADWINDTSALQDDPDMAAVAADARCPIVLMHRFVPPRTAADRAGDDVREQIADRLARRMDVAIDAGIAPESIVLDPGLGFGTLHEDSLAILADVAPLRRIGRPLLCGPSRKSFVGRMTGRAVGDRVFGTAATVALLASQGVEILRVHDVAAMVDVVRVADQVRNHRSERDRTHAR